MTLAEVVGLEWTPEALEKLTDKELIELLSPCFNVTRPEMATKPTNGIRKYEQTPINFKMQERLKLAAQAGIDISIIANRRRKK